ncbi:MAG: TonB-dependent receptor, partial [Bryobacteraceae bacterium]
RAWDVKTDSSGSYLIPFLPSGQYRVEIETTGFKKFAREFTIEVDQRARVDAALAIGAMTESVTVSGQAILLEGDTSSLGQVVSKQDVMSLPLNGRNPFGLTALAPGVTPMNRFASGIANQRAAIQAAAANNFSSDGGVTGYNSFYVDGVSVVVCCQGQPATTPSVDSVEEFKVQTNAAQAEFGYTSGATINIVSKSGTNALHGLGFWYLRNEQLDANGFFSNRNGTRPLPGRDDMRTPLRYAQYGFSLGGPVYIPKVYDGRNKTFFHGGFERIRVRRVSFGVYDLPSLAMRSGNFAEAPSDIYDPATTTGGSGKYTRSPFPGRQIPASRMNPIALNLLKLVPTPQRLGIVDNNDSFASGRDDDWQGNVRLDHQFSPNYRTFARFALQDGEHEDPVYWHNIASPGYAQYVAGKTFVLDNVVTISPTLVANFRYGLAWQTNYKWTTTCVIEPGTLESLGFPASYVSQLQGNCIPPQSWNGMSGPGSGGASAPLWSHYTHSSVASLTAVRGKHIIKTGWEGRLVRENRTGLSSPSGTFTYAPNFIKGPDPSAAIPSGASPYMSFASYMLGLPTSGSVTINGGLAMQMPYSAWYVQDDWKLTSKLTLNLGLRYDLEFGPTERFDRFSRFDPYVTSPIAAQAGMSLRGMMTFAGVDEESRRRWNSDANNFGPRVGFAYRAADSLVFRGGYGIYYLPGLYRIYSVSDPGFSQTTSFVSSIDGVTPVGSLSNPFPSGLDQPLGSGSGPLNSLGSSVSARARDYPSPYVQQWNFNIQRALRGNVLLDVAYAGSHGVKLPISLSLTQIPTSEWGSVGDSNRVAELNTSVSNPFYGIITSGALSGKTVTRSKLLTQYSQYTDAGIALSAGNSSYHSFRLRAQKRMSDGFTATLSYTISKNIGDVNNDVTGFLDSGTGTGAGDVGYQNNYDIHNERSVLSGDLPQRLAVSGVWQVPFGRGRRFGSHSNWFTDGVLGGWQVNGMLTVQAGFPLKISPSGSPAYAGSRASRVPGEVAVTSGDIRNRLGGVSSSQGYINPSAFRLSRS